MNENKSNEEKWREELGKCWVDIHKPLSGNKKGYKKGFIDGYLSGRKAGEEEISSLKYEIKYKEIFIKEMENVKAILALGEQVEQNQKLKDLVSRAK